ncbi:hypothetical protein HDU67_006701 [Dinochytrium kinnereticum]|nr:hypothetical protein HDU67_006701 [Dinochytrium kinnereticum]
MNMEMQPRSWPTRISVELEAAFASTDGLGDLASGPTVTRRRSAGELSGWTTAPDGKDGQEEDDLLLYDSSSTDLLGGRASPWKNRRKSNPPPKITTLPNSTNSSVSFISSPPAHNGRSRPKTPIGSAIGRTSLSYAAVPISPMFDILSTGGIERPRPWNLEEVGLMPESQFLKILLKLSESVQQEAKATTAVDGGGEGDGNGTFKPDPTDRLKELVWRRLNYIKANDDAARMSRMPYWRLAMARIPALAVTMMLELGVGAVIAKFDDTLKEHIIMAAFIPVLSAVSGRSCDRPRITYKCQGDRESVDKGGIRCIGGRLNSWACLVPGIRNVGKFFQTWCSDRRKYMPGLCYEQHVWEPGSRVLENDWGGPCRRGWTV